MGCFCLLVLNEERARLLKWSWMEFNEAEWSRGRGAAAHNPANLKKTSSPLHQQHSSFHLAWAGEWNEWVCWGAYRAFAWLAVQSNPINSCFVSLISLRYINSTKSFKLIGLISLSFELAALLVWLNFMSFSPRVCLPFGGAHGAAAPITAAGSKDSEEKDIPSHQTLREKWNRSNKNKLIYFSPRSFILLVPHCPSTIKSNHSAHSKERNEIDLCVEWAAAVILAPAPRGSPNATSIDSIHKLKFIHFIKLTVA